MATSIFPGHIRPCHYNQILADNQRKNDALLLSEIFWGGKNKPAKREERKRLFLPIFAFSTFYARLEMSR